MLKATLEQWRMFKAVVEAGGFNHAAVLVNKSQSSVHHAVNKLEESLGVPLFENDGRKIKLSEEGKLLLSRATCLLEEAKKLESVAHGLQHGVESQLRIAVDLVFPADILNNVLDTVSQKYPYLRIELIESVLSGANSLLDSGQVDLAICPFPHPDGFTEELCNICFVAVASPAHPLNNLRPPLTVKDLKTHRQIVVRDSSSQRKTDSGWLGAEQRWTVSHISTSIEMIKSGLGFAWLPERSIKTYLDEGTLVKLPLKQGSSRQATLHLCFEDGEQLGPAAREFIGTLRYELIKLQEREG
ncbi:LysR family transcriptional regulator [Alteromonas sp. ASW11-130]|uniref:LysR family transcriptional regulator n=1 Tax=Alteromonas sp. ASW11-130 TaxID=3015775 RepID=UPI002241A475|nr:LysR family transcriptional regulator [Alteromonas sp. ASW11-130]MCW8090275.1 LysR family transcriptional regulator [Alteromonas sp. ASW11-130]